MIRSYLGQENPTLVQNYHCLVSPVQHSSFLSDLTLEFPAFQVVENIKHHLKPSRCWGKIPSITVIKQINSREIQETVMLGS